MKFALLFVCALIAFNSLSQDYQIIHSNDIHYFMADDYDSDYDLIRAVRIDSVNLSSADSIFYAFKNIRRNSPDTAVYCDFVLGGNWFGDKVIIQENGVNIVLNQYLDSIYIETLAALNDTFLLYKYSSGDSILGVVTALDELSFLGFTDSVKTIKLIATSGTFNLAPNEIKLSKNHGIYQLFPFHTFPEPYEPAVNIANHYTLCGQDNPRLGITKPTFYDVNMLEVGDQFLMVQNYCAPYPDGKEDTSRYTVLEKVQISPNFMRYLISRSRYYHHVTINDWHYPVDTTDEVVYVTYAPYEIHSEITDVYTRPYLPGEFAIEFPDLQTSFLTFEDRYSSTCGYDFKQIKVQIYPPDTDTTECFSVHYSSHILSEMHWINGTGGARDNDLSNFYETFLDLDKQDTLFDYRLIYRINSGSICGEFVPSFISVPEYEENSSFGVYPNPGNGLIYIAAASSW